jgi:hypothetical protein
LAAEEAINSVYLSEIHGNSNPALCNYPASYKWPLFCPGMPALKAPIEKKSLAAFSVHMPRAVLWGIPQKLH